MRTTECAYVSKNTRLIYTYDTLLAVEYPQDSAVVVKAKLKSDNIRLDIANSPAHRPKSARAALAASGVHILQRGDRSLPSLVLVWKKFFIYQKPRIFLTCYSNRNKIKLLKFGVELSPGGGGEGRL